MSKKIKEILLKKKKNKIVSLTAYSKNFAKIFFKNSEINGAEVLIRWNNKDIKKI